MPFSTYTLGLQDDYYYVGMTGNFTRRLQEHQDGGCPFTAEHPFKECIEVKNFDTKEAAMSYEREKTLTLMRDKGIDNVRGSSWTSRQLTDETRSSLDHIIKHDDNACYKCGGKGHYSSNCPEGQNVSGRGCKSATRGYNSGRGATRGYNSSRGAARGYNSSRGAAHGNKPYSRGAGGHAHHPPTGRAQSSSNSGGYKGKPPRGGYNSSRGSAGHGGYSKPSHPTPAAEVVCGRCGRDGHATRDCYASTYTGGVAMDSQGSRKESGACYKCGRTSHWAGDCYAKTNINGDKL